MSPNEQADNDRLQRADRLLAAALDLPVVEREPFLARECGDDEQLRKLVERLVRRTEETTTGGSIEEVVPDLSGSLLGRYRLVREVGRGGMGVVYEAVDETLKRTVAIKVLPARSIDARSRERFLREAQAAAALNHPNIVALHDTGESAERPFLVMEFVPGRSLDDQPPESIEEALAIAGHVCDALEHAHSRGLVHRDLKPGNVLVTREGGELVVKLTDMGIALGVVIGASPAPETFGEDIKSQLTYWEDHKGTYWSVSGGENAWFTMSPYYPRQPSFWWPAGKPGFIDTKTSVGEALAAVPFAGDSLSFLPTDIRSIMALAEGAESVCSNLFGGR